MESIKLIALDMDGTLLNEFQEVSSENARWIQKALDAGITVCFATGRGYQSALPYAEQLKLDTPMITVNGGEIWRRPGVLHRRSLMPSGTVKRLYELALHMQNAGSGRIRQKGFTIRRSGLSPKMTMMRITGSNSVITRKMMRPVLKFWQRHPAGAVWRLRTHHHGI